MKVLAAICMAILLAACNPDVRGVSLHIGDSIMESAAADVQRRQVREDSAVLSVFNAVAGARIGDAYWVDRLANIQARVAPDIVFVALGSNDILWAGWPNAPTNIDTVMTAMPAGVPVYWILPTGGGPGLGFVRDELLAATVRWPDLNLLDFELVVLGYGLNPADMLLADYVHLTVAGKKAWADMIQDTIDLEMPVP